MTNIFVDATLEVEEKNMLKEKIGAANLLFREELPVADQKKHFLQAEVAFGNLPSAWLKETTQLRWLQLESTGFNEYLWFQNSPQNQITVTNLKGMYGIPVAETAVAGIMTLYRATDQLALLKVGKKWIGKPLRHHLSTLHRRKVLIAGGGAIGGTIKQMLSGFQCEVTVLGKSSGDADIYTHEELDAVLPHMDVVISCLPETRETVNMFNRERLGLFKPKSIFVNVGRGSAVDETALVEALNTGKLGGSVIDVTHTEPLPADHPLWNCPNTLLTQHTGGGSSDEPLHKAFIFLDNLNRYLKGEPLQYVIDFARKY